MKAKFLVNVGQYEHIEFEVEGTMEEIFKKYKEAKVIQKKPEVDKIAKVVAKEKAKLDGAIDAIDYQEHN